MESIERKITNKSPTSSSLLQIPQILHQGLRILLTLFLNITRVMTLVCKESNNVSDLILNNLASIKYLLMVV